MKKTCLIILVIALIGITTITIYTLANQEIKGTQGMGEREPKTPAGRLQTGGGYGEGWTKCKHLRCIIIKRTKTNETKILKEE